MAINVKLLELRFQEHTGCSAAKAQEHTKRYIWLCALEMLTDHFSDDSGSGYYINATRLQNELGDIIVKGRRFYIWQTFQSFRERIFTIPDSIAAGLGSNTTGKITMAQSQYTLEDVILATGTPEQLCVEVYKPYAEQMQQQDYDCVQIDMRSLGNYIKSNIANTNENKNKSAKYTEELERNFKQAHKLWMLATAFEGMLPQVRNDSVFGRKYYRGPNLQNMSKTVRHAALGQCHEYDIESSVFAWKLSWFRAINQQKGETHPMPSTLEYLDHKKAIRNRLANTVFGTDADWAVKIIKEFVTAIGFGAPKRSTGYMVDSKYKKPALATIIQVKEKLDAALADPWVVEFYAEQAVMNDAIIAMGKANGLEPEWRKIPELLDKANRLLPNSVIAYLYQSAEREILDWVENFCADREVLLTVHDCIYTRRPVKLVELRSGIASFGEFYKITHEEHKPWGWEEPVATDDPFYDPRDAAVAKKLEHYDNSRGADHWTGSGYDGRQEYSIEDDPYFDVEES